jgi:hypothetical protein
MLGEKVCNIWFSNVTQSDALVTSQSDAICGIVEKGPTFFSRNETSANFCSFQGNRDQSYKTFYSRNLRIFLTSYSVCPWQTCPA